MSKHTEEKLTVETYGDFVYIFAGVGNCICKMQAEMFNINIDFANDIMHCWNCYDELIKALKVISIEPHAQANHTETVRDMINIAKQALRNEESGD